MFFSSIVTSLNKNFIKNQLFQFILWQYALRRLENKCPLGELDSFRATLSFSGCF